MLANVVTRHDSMLATLSLQVTFSGYLLGVNPYIFVIER
jgi:hypothetical protein